MNYKEGDNGDQEPKIVPSVKLATTLTVESDVDEISRVVEGELHEILKELEYSGRIISIIGAHCQPETYAKLQDLEKRPAAFKLFTRLMVYLLAQRHAWNVSAFSDEGVSDLLFSTRDMAQLRLANELCDSLEAGQKILNKDDAYRIIIYLLKFNRLISS